MYRTVCEFINENYTPYDGDGSFLAPISEKTAKVLQKYEELDRLEKSRGGVLGIDTEHVSSLLTYPAAYIDKENEVIVGFQTGSPMVRGVQPFGGMRMAEQACEKYGFEIGDNIKEQFRYRTTHNDGVFRVYTDEMKLLRKYGVITGLPDAYGRGRIIGDYRRVPLYGADYLIAGKKNDIAELRAKKMDEENIKLIEEVYRQIDFLEKLKEMAGLYGYDISAPAKDSKEAVQWLYFAYLGAIKEQNGAAMSLGRVSTFLDIYFERDRLAGVYSEERIQELVDQFVIKLRMARQLRTPDYDELFAGDPTWVTEAIGGINTDGRHMVTRTSFRFLHTLYNLKPAPEPNLTVLWSPKLPENFKRFCAKASIDTNSVQYENDELMRPEFGCDYGIACCVSAMRLGEQMQYFGARCNLAKVLLLAINGGREELTGELIGPEMPPLTGHLEYCEAYSRFKKYIDWVAGQYVNTMNVIHYMHDKYAYEKLQMALHNTRVERLMAFGVAGLSVVADSLSAIKYGQVTAAAGSNGVIEKYITEAGAHGFPPPAYGNDDDRVDKIARGIIGYFFKALKKHKTYRGAKHTLSVLTITSNVAYGKKTGATPDGRASGEPFAPGANPMHGREKSGALASLNSIAKIPYEYCRDGISNTFSITPGTLGKDEAGRVSNLVTLLDGYFTKGGHHININVLTREKLVYTQKHPEKYPNLTIRVSGYAVRFNRLTAKNQDEVIERTYF